MTPSLLLEVPDELHWGVVPWDHHERYGGCWPLGVVLGGDACLRTLPTIRHEGMMESQDGIPFYQVIITRNTYDPPLWAL